MAKRLRPPPLKTRRYPGAVTDQRRPDPLRVALLGCGVVGTQVARLLLRDADELEHRIGARLELAGIAVRRADRARDGDLPAELFTTDAHALVSRDDIDIVIEVIGGIEPARELILAALENGASVVTANKALLAEDGARLFEAAAKAQRDLYFEAAVAGAIPIVRPLQDSLAGDSIQRVLGIVNGTTNYILDEMTTKGLSFSDALAAAQRLGYAEADPTADIEGFDAAAKAAIVASLAFHTRVGIADVYREGITEVTANDIAAAAELGCVVKLLAICDLTETDDGPAVSARVYPALVPEQHPLASVHGAYNAVFVEAESAGQLMFYGPGAGGGPTASAVLGDLVGVARNRVNNVFGPGETSHADLAILERGRSRTRYHISIDVDDRPGVLSAVAAVFADFGVSIRTVRQEGHGSDAQLVIVSHEGEEAALAATVEALHTLDAVRDVSSVLRVEGIN